MMPTGRKTMSTPDALSVLTLLLLLAWNFTSLASAVTSMKQNLADLITQSELILLGTVNNVSDGFTVHGIPYTEITLQVGESLKGMKTPVYRFRQFGLQEERKSEEGPDYLGISPQGTPRWSNGETVLVFLHHPADHTGLQATVGMGQGKLNIVDGRLERSANIRNLFENLVVEAGDLTPDQMDMLRGKAQVVGADSLLALLRRAVSESWVENGIMHHAE